MRPVFNQLALSLLILLSFSLDSLSQSGNCLRLDGADDFAILNDASQYFTSSSGATGVSMTGWFCTNSYMYGQGFFGFRTGLPADHEMYVIQVNLEELECRYKGANGLFTHLAAAGTIQYGVWQHIAWVFNGTTTRLYIDGILAGFEPSNGIFDTNNTPFAIGKSNLSGFNFVYGGSIDEVSVWSKALSQSEIQDMMLNELVGNENDLELYYKMNQGIPGGNNSAISQLISEVGGAIRNSDIMNMSLNGPNSNFVAVGDPSFTFDDFCENSLINSPVITGDPGGIFTFNPLPSDGATINSVTGSISGGITGTTYTVEYTLPGCPVSHTEDVQIINQDQASFVLSSFCPNEPNSAIIIGTPGGTFSFDQLVFNGETINSSTGEITNGVAGTTYAVQYVTDGICPDNQTLNVTVTNEDDTSFTLTDFCAGQANAASDIATPGGTFIFDSFPFDGSSLDASTGEIVDGVTGTTYYIEYSTNFTCPASAVESVTVLDLDNPNFTVSNFCEGLPNAAIGITTPGGSFSFNPAPTGTETINSVTGEISNEVGGTTYFIEYTTNGPCPNSAIEALTVIGSPSIGNIVETCAPDQLTYTVTFDISGGDPTTYNVTGDAGTLTGNSFTSAAIASGTNYDFTVNDGNNCYTDNINGNVVCTCAASATISGDIDVCSGVNGDLTIDFLGTGPWTFIYAIDAGNQPQTTTTDNPYTLSTSTVGTYTLVSVADANCVGSVSSSGSVSQLDSPTMDNVVETCAADQLTYTVTFDISGGDPTTYNVTGDPGTLAGNSFTSDPIATGTNYNFTVNDGNNCNTDNINGNVVCTCAASATISGDIDVCSGVNGDLTIDFFGTGPWTFIYAIDAGNQPQITTTDNPYSLSTSTLGTYTLVAVSDANCVGSVSGSGSVTQLGSPTIGNILETCAADQLTYTVTFDISGGDPATYNVTGDSGTLVGNSFTSDPIPSGTNYNFTVNDGNNCNTDNINGNVVCTCAASATISGDIDVCSGVNGDLTIDFFGTGPWTFIYAIDAGNQPQITTTDNPYSLSTSTLGTYTLVAVSDANCVGSVSGSGSVTQLGSPTIGNILETCAADQLTYTVTFDISGGDPATYNVTGDSGTLVGNSFTSDPIPSGTNYDFTVNDGNNCNTDNINGNVVCTCAASAIISGDIDVCSGVSGDLTIDFLGTGPWTFIYAIDAGNQPQITTTDNPYSLSTSTLGTYTLVSVSDANCVGSVSGSGSVTQLGSPTIGNVVETCAADQLTYTVTFDISGGDPTTYNVTGDAGTLTGSSFTSDPIASGTNYDFTVNDGNNCNTDNINGNVVCTCAASAIISGNIDVCAGVNGDLTIDFLGTGPWTFIYAIDAGNQPQITTTDNPYTLSTSTIGAYSLVSVSDANCVGSVSGSGSVTQLGSPTIGNVVETCSADQLTYIVTFDISGGHPTTYNVTGDAGTLTGSSFTSDPIASGTNYDFTVNDGNNCNTDNITGNVVCNCAASAAISGSANICPGVYGDLTIDFVGTGPWTFVYAINAGDQPQITTTDNPYTLSSAVVGTYTLTSVSDANCIGSVSGSATINQFGSPAITNLVETCSLDQSTYTITFNINNGDVATYNVTGDTGTLTGNAFTSDPIASGANYDFTISDLNNCSADNVNGNVVCTCTASAELSGNINTCPGVNADLTIDFLGTGPWTFVYAIDAIDQSSVTTSANPYTLSTSTLGAYTLTSVSDANCTGSISGGGSVAQLDSPTIVNLVETCSLDQLTYTVTFDISGGEANTYNVTGDTGTLIGSSFTSDPILSGTNYDFIVNDGNNCSSDNENGNFNCSCTASAELSGNINTCPGVNADLTIDFLGTGPWTFVYAIDAIDQPSVTTSANPYTLSTSTVGAYTLTSVSDANCTGSISGSGSVAQLDSPTIVNLVETCSLDQLTYTVTFDISGGDATTYIVTGDTGTLTGSSFTSNPILSGTNYDFTVNDGNNCSTDNENGNFNCSCVTSAALSGDVNICPGVIGELTIDFLGTGPWTFVYAIDSFDQAPIMTSTNPYTLSTSAVGTYTMTSASDANCVGSVSGSGTISEVGSPSINSIVEICSANQLTYVITFVISGGDAPTYNVAGNPGTIVGNIFTSDPIASGSNYDFTVSDVNNCSSDNINGNVLCNCAASATISGAVSTCFGDSGNLSIDFTGTGPWTFVYAINAMDQPQIVTSDNPYLLSTSIVGTYTLTSVNDVNCVGSVSGAGNVSVLSSPLISNVVETCSIDETTYTVSFDITGGDLATYVVSGDNGVLIGNSFVSDPIATGGNYNFIVNDGNNCNSDNVFGLVDCVCPAGVTFGGDVSYCAGSFGFIDIEYEGTGLWSTAFEIDGVDQGFLNGNFNPMAFPVLNPGVYVFTSISDANCTNLISDTVVVTEIEIPGATITGDTAVCFGESTELTFDLTGMGPWDVTYAINSIPQPPISIASTPHEITVNEEGAYTVVDVSNAYCSGPGSGSANVVINDLPTASIIGDIAICAGTPATLLVNLTGSPNYELTFSVDGIIDTLVISDLILHEMTINSPGTYELLTISDFNCSGSVTGIVNVTEEQLPTASLNGDFVICEGTEQLIPVVLFGSPDWTIDYTIDNIAQPPLVTSNSPFLIPAIQAGEYLITTITDNYCDNIGTGSANISFYDPLTIMFTDPPEICIGEQAIVSVSGSGGLGDNYVYEWSTADLLSSSDSLAIYQPNVSTSIQVSMTDDCGTNSNFNIPITVNQLPPISILSDATICGSDFVEIFNTTPQSFVGQNCMWSIDGDTIMGCNSINYFFGDDGQYDVSLEVTSPEGCINQEQFVNQVNVLTQSTADFSFEEEGITTSNSILQFENESSSDVTNFIWTFSDLDISNEQDPEYEFPNEEGPGTYQVCLEVGNAFGCPDSICKLVNVEGEVTILIPNTFTPDGDGLNEFFYPVVIGADEVGYEFRIYNRQGNLMFVTNDLFGKWNGSLERKTHYAPDGMYNWQINAKVKGSADKKEYFGSFMLLR